MLRKNADSQWISLIDVEFLGTLDAIFPNKNESIKFIDSNRNFSSSFEQ